MTDIENASGTSSKVEVVKRIRLSELYLARPIENDEQYESRMKREEAFLDLQRELIQPYIGKDKAKHVTDYYEAGLPTGFFAMISGKTAIEMEFIAFKVLGKELFERTKRYYVPTPSDEKPNTPEEKALLYKYYFDFNSEVLFSNLTFPASINYKNEKGEEVKANLFVLGKGDTTIRERAEIVERANNLLDVLSYSDEFYRYKNRHDPWEDLIKGIQRVSLRADPMQQVSYGKLGKVTKWITPNEICSDGGMMVRRLEDQEPIILGNARNKKKFGHLIGKHVIYQDKGVGRAWSFNQGELIATDFSLPLPKSTRSLTYSK